MYHSCRHRSLLDLAARCVSERNHLVSKRRLTTIQKGKSYNSIMTTFNCVWTNLSLETKEDPKYGKPVNRSSHGLSFCSPNNKLFLYGGERIARTPLQPNENQSCWILDLVEKQWKFVNANTDEAPSPRVAHAQAVHHTTTTQKDGGDSPTTDVYIFGGRAGITMSEKPMQDLWKFNIETETWTELKPNNDEAADIPEARSFHKMLCCNDALYVFGGCGPSGRLADLHKYDIATNVWTTLPKSALRGRGGPNFVVLDDSNGTTKKLGVINGFAGEETNDGHVYNIETESWDESIFKLSWDEEESSESSKNKLRPRSVCASGYMPSLNKIVIFGGEVDPSDLGHEGAGGFENDVIILDTNSSTGIPQVLETLSSKKDTAAWPESRGWSDAAIHPSKPQLFVFGGLSGDDKNPQRLDDMWQCEIIVD